MSIIKIHNVETNEITERDMTEEELFALDKITNDGLQKIEEQKQNSKIKAALLEKLGITEEEAKLLLS